MPQKPRKITSQAGRAVVGTSPSGRQYVQLDGCISRHPLAVERAKFITRMENVRNPGGKARRVVWTKCQTSECLSEFQITQNKQTDSLCSTCRSGCVLFGFVVHSKSVLLNREKVRKITRKMVGKQSMNYYWVNCSGPDCQNLAIDYRRRFDGKSRCISCARKKGNKPFSQLHASLKTRCEKRRIFFDLTREEMIFAQSAGCCFYCGVSLIVRPYGRCSIWLDRIDSRKGYVPENVTMCCGKCNWVKKQILTARETMIWALLAQNDLCGATAAAARTEADIASLAAAHAQAKGPLPA